MDEILRQIAISPSVTKVSSFAPATSANFAVGFDLMGFAISGVGDKVHLSKRDDNQLVIQDIIGVLGKNDLSVDIDKNVCSAVIKKFLIDYKLKLGLDIVIEKGIPLGSGIGGSAASSVAAILAVNAFLTQPLPKKQLIEYAIYGESLISGGVYHGDNAVPSMFGGLVLLQSSKPCEFIELPSLNLCAAIAVPNLKIETKEARKLIDVPFSIKEVVAQTAKTAAVVSALYENDLDRFKKYFIDVLIEPKRKMMITGFDKVKQSAYRLGALGFGISGSGPAVFALGDSLFRAQIIADELVRVFAQEGLSAQSYVSDLKAKGGEVILKEKV
ncbi:homoserine kinase [Caedibacter taeniospiralis]|uniref:homoserine kinase n=1 Tax=Caedibacter taeniospiralis TaxID=28907 RepID=UPI000C26F710|nr:homoserine kinase [Caedibacter taeniospiralis]